MRRHHETGRASSQAPGRPGRGRPPGNPGTFPVELRLRVVRQIVDEGFSKPEVARIFGLHVGTIAEWVRRYRKGGVEALIPKPIAPVQRPHLDPRREAVAELKREHPDYGTRRIADVLRRCDAIGVSESTVRRILHEAGLLEDFVAEPAREHPVRRFERAQPNELWQSDIFTFLLRRHERVYVAAFMDDCSRFVVGFAIAHHQRSTLVLEAFDRGVSAYGVPREVLTDQGRQYCAWRGTTEFEEELRRQGIRHIKSRPQHPQTLGKIERFWKTLWTELISKTVFSDFADCARRIGLYIDGYNFQRPHQALAGLVPADRFFRSAPEVRAAVERSVQANAMRLAQERPPRKPFYLVGRLGDRDLSIAAGEDGLRVRVGNEEQTIPLKRESDDEWRDRTDATTQEATLETDAEVAPRSQGPGRDRPTAMPDDPVRTLGREAGDGGDRRARPQSELVLPARAARPGGDALCGRADASGPQGGGEVGTQSAHVEGDEARAGEAAAREAAPADAQGGEDGPGKDPGIGPPALDEAWERTFADLGEDEWGAHREFDTDDDARRRALTWDRKLAGETAETGSGTDAATAPDKSTN